MKKILLSLIVLIMTGTALPALKIGASVGELGVDFGSTHSVSSISIFGWRIDTGYVKLMKFYLTSDNKNIPLRFGISVFGYRWDGETVYASLFPVEIIYMPFNLQWLNVYGSAGVYSYRKQQDPYPFFLFASDYKICYSVGISLRASFLDNFYPRYYINNNKIFIEYRESNKWYLGIALDGGFFVPSEKKK